MLASSAWYSVFFLLLTLWCIALSRLIGRQDLILVFVLLQGVAAYVAWSRYLYCRKHQVTYSRALTTVGHVHFLAGLLAAFGLVLHSTITYAAYGGFVRWAPVSVLLLGLLLAVLAALGPRRPSHWLALGLSSAMAYFYEDLLNAMYADQEGFVIGFLRAVLAASLVLLFAHLREVLPAGRRMRILYYGGAVLSVLLLVRLFIYLGPAERGIPLGTVPIPHAETLFWSNDGERIFCGGASVSGDAYVLYEFARPHTPEDQEAAARVRIHRFKAAAGMAAISRDDRYLLLSLERVNDQRQNSLVLYDLEAQIGQIIFTHPGSLHFPFISNGDPWSPSGRYLLFTSNHYAKVEGRVYDREAVTIRTLGEGTTWRRSFWMPGAEDRVCFAPDTSAYIRSATAFNGLLSCAPDGTDVRPVLDFDHTSVSYFYYPADGKLVVKGQRYYLCSLETGQVEPLAIDAMRFLETAWSPAGNRFATLSEDQTLVIITEDQAPKMTVAFSSPGAAVDSLAWSAYPSLLLFHIKHASAWLQSHSIMGIDPETSTVRRISSAAMRNPDRFLRGNRDFFVLSPDRRSLVFVRRAADGGLFLYLIDFESGV